MKPYCQQYGNQRNIMNSKKIKPDIISGDTFASDSVSLPPQLRD